MFELIRCSCNESPPRRNCVGECIGASNSLICLLPSYGTGVEMRYVCSGERYFAMTESACFLAFNICKLLLEIPNFGQSVVRTRCEMPHKIFASFELGPGLNAAVNIGALETRCLAIACFGLSFYYFRTIGRLWARKRPSRCVGKTLLQFLQQLKGPALP